MSKSLRVARLWWAVVACGLSAATALGASLDGLTPVRAFREFNKGNSPELPESIVTDLLQDDQGRLWIATLGGLATYDGRALTAVRDPQAPPGGGIALARRAAGGLYASSRRGVHVFDGRGWRLFATAKPVATLAEHGGRFIWAVFDGRVWSTPAGESAPLWQPVAVALEAGAAPTLLADHEGGVYVLGRERALHCRDGACETVAGATPPPERSTAAAATRSGALWVGTWDGRLFMADPGAARWTSIDLGAWPSGGIRSLTEDARGQLWAGGMARLCHGGPGEAWTCWGAEAGLPDSAALALLADREGTLWLGLNGAGLLQWVGGAWSHLRQWPGAVAARGFDVTGVAATHDGGALVSVFGKGILRWDGRKLTAWGRREGLDEDIRAVVEPEPGVVWAAGRHGLFERSGEHPFRRALALDSGFASGFVQAPGGAWYAWTEQFGIYRRGVQGWQPDRELDALLPDRFVSSMLWTGEGELWIGTPAGLVHRASDGGSERRPLGAEHAMPESASALLEAAPGQIWVGGLGGVAILSADRPRLLSSSDGVPGNVYFLRRAADGSVWAGGSRGIARYRAGRFTRYDANSGLISAECNQGAAVFPDGSLLAATSSSLARFDAGVAPLPTPPLRVSWRDAPEPAPDGVAHLAAEERRLLLGWSAPWLGPEPVEYRTRVGARAAWSPATRGVQMAVENLAPGVSEIAVQARLAAGDEQPWTAPLTLRVDVAPRLWETAAARVAAAALAVALGLFGARLHARRLHERRAGELARLRSDFMASASHELRTPIAQIRLFADTLRLGRARDEQERVEALDTIHRATQRLEALAGNLLQLARGEGGRPAFVAQRTAVAELLEGVVRELSALASAKDVAIGVEVPPGLHAWLDADGVRQLVANLVDNAVKYGPPGQGVRVKGEAVAEGLRLSVEDQGPGIPRAARERVWQRFERLERDRNSAVSGTGIGLAVVRELVERAGGRAWIEDAAPAGTRVVVVLPQVAR